VERLRGGGVDEIARGEGLKARGSCMHVFFSPFSP